MSEIVARGRDAADMRKVVAALPVALPPSTEDETVAFAVAINDAVVMMGGCARKDVPLQAQFVPGSEVIEIESALRQAPGDYRVDRSGERPRLVRIGV